MSSSAIPKPGVKPFGALFKRERMNPGPVFQVSAEAAEAVGMLAGAPTGARSGRPCARKKFEQRKIPFRNPNQKPNRNLHPKQSAKLRPRRKLPHKTHPRQKMPHPRQAHQRKR